MRTYLTGRRGGGSYGSGSLESCTVMQHLGVNHCDCTHQCSAVLPYAGATGGKAPRNISNIYRNFYHCSPTFYQFRPALADVDFPRITVCPRAPVSEVTIRSYLERGALTAATQFARLQNLAKVCCAKWSAELQCCTVVTL